jgi:hypothetical protein
VHPLIAFAGPDIRNLEPKAFVDPPDRAAAFAGVGFVVMSRQVLDSPLGAVDTTASGKVECCGFIRGGR